MSPATIRQFNYVVAALFGVIGITLFIAPDWSADHFAWTISPFVAMTMGGWYIGNAAFAAAAGRIDNWSHSHPVQIVTWSFGLLQGLLLILHYDVLRFDSVLALAYMATLAVAALNTCIGVVDWARTRPAIEPEGTPTPWWFRIQPVLFVVYVGALVLLLSDGIEPDGKIWPGPLSLLSARAFGAFFGSLVLGMIPLIRARVLGPVIPMMLAGQAAIIPITIAAFVYYDSFDFTEHPGGLLYIGSYLVAFFSADVILGYAWVNRLRPVERASVRGAA